MTLLTLRQAAAQIGRSPTTLRNQVLAGRLRGRKLGRDWLVSQRELNRYVRQQARPQAPKRN